MPSMMQRCWCRPATRTLLLLLAGAVAQAQGPGPEAVVVVANGAVEGSVRVAKAYLQRREIPEDHLIILHAPAEERISREAYVASIHNPLATALLERKLVNAFAGSDDVFGRRTLAVFDNPVRYLVLCYGMPLAVTETPAAQLDDTEQRRRYLKGASPELLDSFASGPMARNEASVDGELALLLKGNTPLNGFVPNPLHNNPLPGGEPDILRVTRLDGPSPEAVIRMLDSALEGERNGLKGRAYVDEDGRGDGYQMGNDWMARTAELFGELGFDLSHDKAGATFAADARFDAPVLYAGWYAASINGPFRLPGFRFPAGAVAAHLHSFSASTLRDPAKGWVGPLVERGAAATFGNVAEPYLALTHHFDLFFRALANGWNFADAAYFALPGLSWQAIAVGDPLYRPFAKGLDQQLEAVGHPARILADQYVVMRKINLLERAQQLPEARRLAARGMRETPGPALALRRAQLLEAAGEPDKAVTALGFIRDLPAERSGDWGLLAAIADRLRELGDAGSALRIYQNLEKRAMPENLRLAFLKRGIEAARAAGEPAIAVDWQARVNPPPKNPAPAPTPAPAPAPASGNH